MSLPPVTVEHREARVIETLVQQGLEALIVTTPSNIRWLTGFSGSAATVVVTADRIELFTDHRYADRAPLELESAASSASVTVAIHDLGARVAEVTGDDATVGLEAGNVTWSLQRRIADDWLPGAELVATEGVLEQLRSVKDDAEVARIRAAAVAVDEALAETVSALRERPTERGFADRLEATIRAGRADDLGFDTIVASGPNAAIPHHAPGDRVIEPGDLVIIDVGGRIDGYRSDMTRTFCVGALSGDQARHYEVVQAAQQAGVEAMVAGAPTTAVDRAARSVITDAGWGEAFTHGTGHGVGIDIHELPRVSSTSTETYAVGTVATVEPGVYLRGVGGVRIEDTCVVTASGAERLTGYPKDPEV